MSSPSSHGVRTSLASWTAILTNNLVFLMTLTIWTDNKYMIFAKLHITM